MNCRTIFAAAGDGIAQFQIAVTGDRSGGGDAESNQRLRITLDQGKSLLDDFLEFIGRFDQMIGGKNGEHGLGDLWRAERRRQVRWR